MVQRVRGLCRICGKNRSFYDTEHKLCSECAEKYKNGIYTDADIKQRVQGRRPELIPAEDSLPEAALPAGADARPPAEDHPEEALPDKEVYQCDVCYTTVKYGQRICHNCGTWINWKLTRAEEDPDLIICPDCGAVVGTAKHHPDVCPHCNYGA